MANSSLGLFKLEMDEGFHLHIICLEPLTQAQNRSRPSPYFWSSWPQHVLKWGTRVLIFYQSVRCERNLCFFSLNLGPLWYWAFCDIFIYHIIIEAQNKNPSNSISLSKNCQRYINEESDGERDLRRVAEELWVCAINVWRPKR